MSKKNKEKKEKIIYYDSGMTIADMSRVNAKGEKREPSHRDPNAPKPSSSFSDKLHTYFSAVKMMFLPMIIVLFIMTLFYVGLLALTGRLL